MESSGCCMRADSTAACGEACAPMRRVWRLQWDGYRSSSPPGALLRLQVAFSPRTDPRLLAELGQFEPANLAVRWDARALAAPEIYLLFLLVFFFFLCCLFVWVGGGGGWGGYFCITLFLLNSSGSEVRLSGTASGWTEAREQTWFLPSKNSAGSPPSSVQGNISRSGGGLRQLL